MEAWQPYSDERGQIAFFCFVFVFNRLKMNSHSAPQIVVNRTNVQDEADCGEGVDLPTDDHLMTLKALTEKLRLETRRPSYLEWQARLEADRFRDSETGTKGKVVRHKETSVDPDVSQPKLPSGELKGFENIDEALTWLRRELVRHCLNYHHHLIFILF